MTDRETRKIGFRALVACAVLAAGADAATAEVRYFSRTEVLQAFFPDSQRVTYERVRLDPAVRAALRVRLGDGRLPQAEYVLFVARTGQRVDGYAFIGDEPGQHQPISYAVRMSPKGVVTRQEILVYREAHGGEVATPRFRRQFIGKQTQDPVRVGEDIAVVSGATISSHAVARGVRRALAIYEALRQSQRDHGERRRVAAQP